MANAIYLDIRIRPVSAAAQAALGGAVKCDVIVGGVIVSSAYAASVTAALTAASTVAETFTVSSGS